MGKLNGFGGVDSADAVRASREFGTPLYLYDESLIRARCRDCLDMPNAFGLDVRYAMKANSNRTLLRVISDSGLFIDASSLNEARRAHMSGISYDRISLTTQEIPERGDRTELEAMMLAGLRYNVCSLRQLRLIADFTRERGLELSIRVHPGVGSGESATRNTGDNYSCFGIHLNDLAGAVEYAASRGFAFRHVHEHIGSGADPEVWRQNIDLELRIIEDYFPEAETVSFGGGLKEARMPDEAAADIALLGRYAKERLEDFYRRTGRKLKMEIEPGTYIVANSGYAVMSVIDKKSTGGDGFDFIIADGGMEVNARPLLYGSRHPLYIVSRDGTLRSSEFFGVSPGETPYAAVIAGVCCESGDCQTLDAEGHSTARLLAEPEPDDLLLIGGTGAYCSSMSPYNYNSHPQIPEVLLTSSGELRLIRKRQTLEQIVENEI